MATTYKIELQYDLKGNAVQGLKGLSRDAQRANSAVGGLRTAFQLALGVGTFALAKHFFYDFNNEMQKMKIGLATVISTNFHRPFEQGALAAEKMAANFQKMAITSPSTTKDFVDMAQMIAGSVLQSGKGLKDLEDITQGAVTASNALGARPEMLALDIQQMLAGTLGAKDRYARQLLAGVNVHDYHAFNKMSASKRADLTQQSLSTPQIKGAATAFGESTQGVMSTFKDVMEITLGKVGLPLMKAMTAEVKSWTDYIATHQEQIESMGKSLGDGLKEAFSVVKEIVVSVFPLVKDVFGVVQTVLGFVSEHREILLGTVKALLMYKGLMFGGGLIRGAAGIGGGLFKSFSTIGTAINGMVTGTVGASSGLSSLAGALGGPGGAIASVLALGTAAWGISQLLFGETESEKRQRKENEESIKTATEYDEARQRLQAHLGEKKRLGFDPDMKLSNDVGYGLQGKIDEEQAGIKAYEDKLIERGKMLHLVGEDITPGVSRKYILNDRPASGTMADIQTKSEVWGALNKLFEEKAREITGFQGAMTPGGFISGGAGFTEARFGGPNSPFFSEPLTAADVKSPEDLYKMGLPKAADVKVHIDKIEVASDDPDRFVFGAVKAFEEVVRNPTSAEDTIRGGF